MFVGECSSIKLHVVEFGISSTPQFLTDQACDVRVKPPSWVKSVELMQPSCSGDDRYLDREREREQENDPHDS